LSLNQEKEQHFLLPFNTLSSDIMNQIIRIFLGGVTVMIFTFGFLPWAYAHVSFGEYAGNYAVAWVPEPRSPFVGEEVEMTFYLRDLRGYSVNEPFIVTVVIQETFADDKEREIFTASPETVQDGIYKINYRFTRSGNYRVEFNFGKPDEPNVIRDTIYDIEVRETPGISYQTALMVFFPLALLLFLGGFMVARYRYLAS